MHTSVATEYCEYSPYVHHYTTDQFLNSVGYEKIKIKVIVRECHSYSILSGWENVVMLISGASYMKLKWTTGSTYITRESQVT